jgi:uncharacterized membrane protein HdeD (DUF308 family)
MSTDTAATRSPLAATLRPLYFARFAFAVVWAVLLLALPGAGTPPLLTVLVVVYPLVDAAAAAIEWRGAGAGAGGTRSRASTLANIVVSVVAAIALGIASLSSVAAVLVIWGIWAIGSGLAQLLTGLGRRQLGGQWPLILSGGLSVLVGFAFAFQGIQGATSAAGVAGYAIVGGVFFLVSALRLLRR